uniref:AAA+ ATPase domain-containing protein n=1 Tax=Lotharella globosa TaxID=91324 RepID=A0A7S3YRZ4_9EUKA
MVSLAPRFEWMAGEISEKFGMDLEAAKEFVQSNKKELQTFLDKNDIMKYFVFENLEAAAKKSEGKGKKKKGGGGNEKRKDVDLILSSDPEAVQGKFLYFLRMGERPVKAKQKVGEDLIAGELNTEALGLFRETMVNIFDPLLGRMKLGKCSEEKRKILVEQTRKFEENLKDSIANLTGDIYLDVPKLPDGIEMSPKGYKEAAKKESTVKTCRKAVTKWINQLETYIAEDKSNELMEEGNTKGPEQEISFWNRRQLTLINATETLKGSTARTVFGVLQAHSQPLKEPEKPELLESIDETKKLLKHWHELNMTLTHALNEAKDSSRFLTKLGEAIRPCYESDLVAIQELLPVVMNNMKMIYILSRHYGKAIRMTNLFTRITNQLVTRCRQVIYGSDKVSTIWGRDPGEVVKNLNEAIKLRDEYVKQFHAASEEVAKEGKKEKKMSAPSYKKPFTTFNLKRIFNHFHDFVQRAEKLLDMFSAINQYKLFIENHVDGVEDIVKDFNQIIRDFRLREHDLLDYNNTAFERDFVEFNVLNSQVETAVQDLMATAINCRYPMMKKIRIMERFDSVIKQESLRRDLEDKFTKLFLIYGNLVSPYKQQGSNGTDMEALFQKHMSNPPIARNMTKVAGAIHWSRQIYRTIADPMNVFKNSPHSLKIFARREGSGSREAKRNVRVFNKLASELIRYEVEKHANWKESAKNVKKELWKNLIIPVAPNKDKILVNFEPKIINHLKEARHLKTMGFDVPSSIKTVMLLKGPLQRHLVRITKMVKRFNEAISMPADPVKDLFAAHIRNLKKVIDPGKKRLRWTSMSIAAFLNKVDVAIDNFVHLKELVYDIVTNRVMKNIDFVATVLLVKVAKDQTFKVGEFLNEQKKYSAQCCEVLLEKNEEVERGVNDIAKKIAADAKIRRIPAPSSLESNRVRHFFCTMFYNAVVQSLRNSLKYFLGKLESKEEPIFQVNLKLQAPDIVLSPTVEHVQKGVNDVKKCMLMPGEKLMDWGVSPEGKVIPRRTLFERLTDEVAPILTKLEGCMAQHGESMQANLAIFLKLKWLWEGNPAAEYETFVAQEGLIIDDYVNKLRSFVNQEKIIAGYTDKTSHGPLLLLTAQLKKDLIAKVGEWKMSFSQKLYKEAGGELEDLKMELKELDEGLDREIKDILSLNSVMNAQTKIRIAQSSMESKFARIFERLGVLQQYIKLQTEEDAESIMRSKWNAILQRSEQTFKHISNIKGPYKKTLVDKVAEFQVAVTDFDSDYKENGPMRDGINPKEATAALKKFQREHANLDRKMKLYGEGERLFGLPSKSYPTLETTGAQLKLLQKLYGLYNDVLNTIDDYNELSWSDVVANIEEMQATVEGFDKRCRSMPKKLRTWDAYADLKEKLDNFGTILPILTQLAYPSMKQRHWTAIAELVSTPEKKIEFKMSEFGDMKLDKVMEPLFAAIEAKDEIEEICEASGKQEKVEKQLSGEERKWEELEFDFAPWKSRGDVIFKGDKMNEIQTELEESQGAASGLLANKFIKPFKDRADKFAQKLTRVNETLDRWLKVQVMWRSLEAVFTAGDIMRALPKDTRVFQTVDKEWCTRLMEKAKETKNVAQCCEDEYVVNVLIDMRGKLEACQKSLTGYLEKKRSRFPRFYFVSDTALLDILSQGSDKDAVQSCFEKVFAAVNRVVFKGNNIEAIMNCKRGEAEEVPLLKPVAAKGNIEDWLTVLLNEMMDAVKGIVRTGATTYDAMPIEEFIKKSPGQVALLGIQFMWTSDVQEGITRLKKYPAALQEAFGKQKGILESLTKMVTQDIAKKMDRVKIETMVTIQVHQVDVLVELLEASEKKGEEKLSSVGDFAWQRQLRCYYNVEEDDCHVQVANVDFTYCYEYIGCVGRLVITPLTDRCYISLTQAMGMAFGGAPAGPAGTGKTETTKDLARALGKWCVVFNCSDQMHTADTAKLYKGLCQSGSWGCFDEFNRIELEVLSVVAQQVEAIMNALRERKPKFQFPGTDGEVTVDPRLGFFITMNPGYAGRQELPENLKALFRSVAMMVPDREIIIRVFLAAQGYQEYDNLARKFRILYRLCEEQLSAQRHYDFGLRNIISVLRTGGTNLREALKKGDIKDRPDLEEMLMMRTLRDMNLSKLVADDVGLFRSLLKDLFPKQKDPAVKEWPELENKMKDSCDEKGLVYHPSWKKKAIQLYETSLVRHGLMMVGPAGGGKTVATNVLLDALSTIAQAEGTPKCEEVRMNPKAMRAPEMFGENDPLSGEWTDGVFSAIWFEANKANTQKRTWIVCDGPVDAIWIENLNTVLDDNRLLTLANGDRVPMHEYCRILFEPRDLRNASPATVSRAGIVYVSAEDLGHMPIIEAWLLDRAKMNDQSEEEAGIIRTLCDKYITDDHLRWLSRNCTNMMPVMNNHMSTNLLALMTGLLAGKDEDPYPVEVYEKLFLYAFVWSFGSLLETTDRQKLHKQLLKWSGDNKSMPDCKEPSTIYDFYVNINEPEAADFQSWREWKGEEWVFPGDAFNFSTCLIPTVETARSFYLFNLMNKKLPTPRPCLVIGSPGTAKTSIVQQYCFALMKEDPRLIFKKANFSFATLPGMFQSQMIADLEKKSNLIFHPRDGRPMMVFLDDMSMPEVNVWGDQPTLEIVRQALEQGGFYFLDKDLRGKMMEIINVRYISSMTHPGGGRNDIPSRCKRHLYCFNVTPPEQSTVNTIYGTMMRENYKFQELKELADLTDTITSSTIELWNMCKQKLLPTPAKFHYIFNLRDLSRIFGGILNSPSLDRDENAVTQDVDTVVTLWRHECERVLCDKLVEMKDKQWFYKESLVQTKKWYGEEYHKKFKELKRPAYFVSFLRDDKIDPETDEIAEYAERVYEIVPDELDIRKRVEKFLGDYNDPQISGPGGAYRARMDLVLFTDAMEHMMRISRIIGTPMGSALLVGVGGSGRQSLTKLAAFTQRQEVFQIEVVKNYKVDKFKDDIKELYFKVGKEGKKFTWIFADFDVIYEEFLEYINMILSTGEIPGLIAKDERDAMAGDLRDAAKEMYGNKFEDTSDNLYKFFIDRIRDNLHIVLAFSPANPKFAERARKFPGLINCCNIDWFLPWPIDALKDVSNKFVTGEQKGFKLEGPEGVDAKVATYLATVHDLITKSCDQYYSQYSRRVFVTPKSYLSFIMFYKAKYMEKLRDISKKESDVTLGLEKLAEAETSVEGLKKELAVKGKQVAQAKRQTEEVVRKVNEGQKKADVQMNKASKVKADANAKATEIEKEKAAANKLLEAAMPFVRAAEKAAAKVKPGDIRDIMALPKPPEIIQRIMDCIDILFYAKLEKVNTDAEAKTYNGGELLKFITPSWDHSKKLMSGGSFCKEVLDFANVKKDDINEETMELLEPYYLFPGFLPENAKKASSAAEGLLLFVRAMYQYHIASLVAKPLQLALAKKQAELDVANKKLKIATDSCNAAQALVADLQAQLDKAEAKKQELETDQKLCMDKMDEATKLIESLGGEKKRWNESRIKFADDKRKLLGDIALACAFVSYCGPFNFAYRQKLMSKDFYDQCIALGIPVNKDVDVTQLLVDEATIAIWNSQSLPKDQLSVQNGILVVEASPKRDPKTNEPTDPLLVRFPLLIDPQGQALNWLKNREADHFPYQGTTTLGHRKLSEIAKYCIENGKTLLVEGIVDGVIPLFDPILQKKIKKGRGRNKWVIKIDGEEMEYSLDFKMFLLTKVANPLFSPELSAQTTVIDFSVTREGLEDQLLSFVIQNEQPQLEVKRKQLIDGVNKATVTLQNLDKTLLDKLANSKGNLLDDVELIRVLRKTKAKSKEVNEQILQSTVTQKTISEKRELYRPVATRGSIVYFTLVDTTSFNPMYQNSLAQFLVWFFYTLKNSEEPADAKQRIDILIDNVTYNSYVALDRGLFVQHKLTFKLLLTLKILEVERRDTINSTMFDLLFKAGISLDKSECPKHKYEWIDKKQIGPTWKNICMLQRSLSFFSDLHNKIRNAEAEWKKWYETLNPEENEIPSGFEERLDPNSDPSGPMYRLLLIRAFRPDRVCRAADIFVGMTLGKKYVKPLICNVTKTYNAVGAGKWTPCILLLTPGADPTGQIKALAKAQNAQVDQYTVSMGEGQEKFAKMAIDNAMVQGGWALLNNCHLGLGYMNGLTDYIEQKREEDAQTREKENSKNKKASAGEEKEGKKKKKKGKEEIPFKCHDNFRLWITCEAHPKFPISLLQTSIKMTMEPPKGIKAGLLRSYSEVVDEERLGRVPEERWRNLVFSLCFLHSVVQERRKFGPIGWCITYEFNQSDLEASLMFLEKHFYESGGVSWNTIQYMICEVQYGGRITDDYDRVLFNTFGKSWLSGAVDDPDFRFCDAASLGGGKKFEYKIPKSETIDVFHEYIDQVPDNDIPSLFGLHSNADLTLGQSEGARMLDLIQTTRPREASGSEGKTPQEIVSELAAELLARVPEAKKMDEVRQLIVKRPSGEIKATLADGYNEDEKITGMQIPLNVFLFQEIERFFKILHIVQTTLRDVGFAIKGEIIMTPQLSDAVDAIFDGRPPTHWFLDAGGVEIAWTTPALTQWFEGLLQRYKQLMDWLTTKRPPVYWMTGFFNPQGFLTAMRQEVTRRHKKNGWALDEVVVFTRVTSHNQSIS